MGVYMMVDSMALHTSMASCKDGPRSLGSDEDERAAQTPQVDGR